MTVLVWEFLSKKQKGCQRRIGMMVLQLLRPWLVERDLGDAVITERTYFGY